MWSTDAAAQGGYGDALTDILGSKHMSRAVADYAGNGNGATALYVACQRGHVGCVRELLQAGVCVDPKMDACGSTPLHIAVFLAQRDDDKPHRDITEMLLSYKASIDYRNKVGAARRAPRARCACVCAISPRGRGACTRESARRGCAESVASRLVCEAVSRRSPSAPQAPQRATRARLAWLRHGAAGGAVVRRPCEGR